jgi:hypothetical protein
MSETKPMVMATLLTLCGCSREFVLPQYPPPPQWHVPISPGWRLGDSPDPIENPAIRARTFYLDMVGHREEQTPGVLHVLYKERP